MNQLYQVEYQCQFTYLTYEFGEVKCDPACWRHRLRPPRAVLVSEAEVQTEAMKEPEPEQTFFEPPPGPPSPRTPRKKSKVWMGNFVDLFTSKPM